MKLYNSGGPNPRMVRMFMAEKGFEVPKVDVDLRGGENRREPYLKVNPAGQCPALELDDGTVLAEITDICEYVDEKKKDTPSLIGDTPEERASTRMWTRRIDLNICEPAANGLRFAIGLKMFQDRVHCIPQGRRRPEDDDPQAPDMAGRSDGLQAVHRRQQAHHGRHPALRLPRLHEERRPGARAGEHEPHRLVRAHESATKRRRVTRRLVFGTFGGVVSRPRTGMSSIRRRDLKCAV
jgi:hypothetical protein